MSNTIEYAYFNGVEYECMLIGPTVPDIEGAMDWCEGIPVPFQKAILVPTEVDAYTIARYGHYIVKSPAGVYQVMTTAYFRNNFQTEQTI